MRPRLAPFDAEMLPVISAPEDLNHFRRVYGLDVFWKEVPHDDIRPQDKGAAEQIGESVLQSIFGQIPDSEPVVIDESVFYALDCERGEEPDLSGGIPLVRATGYLHYVNGIHVEGDILRAAVANGETVKVQACWHRIVEERGERREVVDVEQSLAVAVQNLAEKFENPSDLRFVLARVEGCYYGFHDAGKSRKTFVPAWHFTFEKDGKLYHQYVNSQNNTVMNSELEIANARRRQ